MRRELEKKFTNENVSEFIMEFVVDIPVSRNIQTIKLFPEATELSKITTFNALFIFLSQYWDYLNHSLLHFIVCACGYGSDAAQRKMEHYCSELKVFRKSVTLRVFWKLGSFKIHDVTSCGWKRAITKHGITADSTLEDVARVQHKVAYELQLQEFAFILEDVLEHSVHVSWLLPCSVVGILLCGLTPALLDELLIEDITLVDEEDIKHDQEGTGCNSCRAVETHHSSFCLSVQASNVSLLHFHSSY